MIILTKNPGRLCNNLWAFAPFIALCLRKNETVFIQDFNQYQDLFENLNYIPNLKFGKKSSYNLRIYLLMLLYNLLPNKLIEIFNIQTDKDFWYFFDKSEVATDKYILFVSIDYQKNSWSDLEFHDELRRLFRPKRCYIDKVVPIFNENRAVYDVIVGVHIRRGDYRKFMKGIYYYDDTIYNRYMIDIERQLAGKRIGFLLCSDEAINPTNYKKFNYFQIEQAEPIEDLYALSLCDYIIGPPSTFSMWASFYGCVPLRVIKSGHETVHLNEFSVIVSQDVFETGEHFYH
jgi:hypothetical protein